MSLPLRKCGLKYRHYVSSICRPGVTSLAEVWIEIVDENGFNHVEAVTSLAEVWIEIGVKGARISTNTSLPLRKCGLKYVYSSFICVAL